MRSQKQPIFQYCCSYTHGVDRALLLWSKSYLLLGIAKNHSYQSIVFIKAQTKRLHQGSDKTSSPTLRQNVFTKAQTKRLHQGSDKTSSPTLKRLLHGSVSCLLHDSDNIQNGSNNRLHTKNGSDNTLTVQTIPNMAQTIPSRFKQYPTQLKHYPTRVEASVFTKPDMVQTLPNTSRSKCLHQTRHGSNTTQHE